MLFINFLVELLIKPKTAVLKNKHTENQTLFFFFVGWFTLASLISSLFLLPNGFKFLKSEALFKVISETVVSAVLACILPLILAIPIYFGFMIFKKRDFNTAFKVTTQSLSITTIYFAITGIISGIISLMHPFNPNTATVFDKTYPQSIILISLILLIISILHALIIAIIASKETYETSYPKAIIGTTIVFLILAIIVIISI